VVFLAGSRCETEAMPRVADQLDGGTRDRRAVGMKLYKPAVAWASAALVLRLLVALILHIYSLQIGYEGFVPLQSAADDRYYFETGRDIVSGSYVDLTSLPNAYPFFLAAVFVVTGPSLLAAKVFNVTVSAATVYLGVIAARHLVRLSGGMHSQQRVAANVAGFLLCLYPASVFYSTQVVKDVLVQSLTMVGLLGVLGIFSLSWLGRVTGVLSMLGATAVLFSLRGYGSIAIILASVTFLVASRIGLGWKIIGVSAAAALPYFMGFGLLGISGLSRWLDLDWLAAWREEVYSIGGSSLGIQLRGSDQIGLLVGWLYSFISVLFGPLPWQITSPIVALSMIDALPVWILSVVLARYIPDVIKRFVRISLGPSDFVLIFAIVLGLGIALFSDNIGANIRLRLPIYSGLYVYAGYIAAMGVQAGSARFLGVGRSDACNERWGARAGPR